MKVAAAPRRHMPERKLFCPVPGCNKAYGRPQALYAHKRNKHPELIHPRAPRGAVEGPVALEQPAAEAEATTPPEVEEQVDVVVDLPRLEMLIERMVAGTEGWRLEQVELLLSRLYSTVHAHRNVADKSGLLEDLEAKYDALCATCHQGATDAE